MFLKLKSLFKKEEEVTQDVAQHFGDTFTRLSIENLVMSLHTQSCIIKKFDGSGDDNKEEHMRCEQHKKALIDAVKELYVEAHKHGKLSAKK